MTEEEEEGGRRRSHPSDDCWTRGGHSTHNRLGLSQVDSLHPPFRRRTRTMHRFLLPGLLLLAACSSDTKSTTPSGDGAETTAPDGEDTDRPPDTDPDGDTGSGSDTDDDANDDTGEDTGVEPEPAWTDGTHSCVEDRYRAYAVRGWEVCADEPIFDDPAHGEAVLSLLSSDLERILTGIDGLSWVHLSARDVVRHRIVQDIVNAYDRSAPK